MVGIGQDVVTKDFNGSIPIRTLPHDMARWNLKGCPNHRLKNLIESCKQPYVGELFLSYIGKIEELGQFLSVETNSSLPAYYCNRNIPESQRA
jgi:hypothetical protein